MRRCPRSERASCTAQRTNASAETVNQATEIRLLAERQMGAFLKGMPKATGTRGNIQEVVSGGTSEAPPDAPATLAEIGLTKKQSARAQKLAAIPADDFAERIEATGGKWTQKRGRNRGSLSPIRPQETCCLAKWCSGRDSNPYAFRHTPLKRVCLPIPPPEHF